MKSGTQDMAQTVGFEQMMTYEEIAKILDSNAFQARNNFRRGDKELERLNLSPKLLLRHLVNTNDGLFKGIADYNFAADCLISFGICGYLNPIFGLNLQSESAYEHFKMLLEKPTYAVLNPFTVTFEPVGMIGNFKKHLDTEVISKKGVIPSAFFEQRDNLQTMLRRKRHTSYGNLGLDLLERDDLDADTKLYNVLTKYDQNEHLRFMALHSFANRLLCHRDCAEDTKKYNSGLTYLHDNIGSFVLPFPAVLAAYFK